LKLIDDTRWRMMFDVGRLPGTWMPKTWGASGDTIKLKVEVEFTSDDLQQEHNDDFFNSHNSPLNHLLKDHETSASRKKVLRVVNNEAFMAPTHISEGETRIKLTNGGWKIMKNIGPMNTDVLRFYFSVEEEVHHRGSDIYIPKGRVYGACGYFPTITNNKNKKTGAGGYELSKKDRYQNELQQLQHHYQTLKEEHDENTKDRLSIFIHNMKLMKQMMDVQQERDKLYHLLEEEKIRDPSKDTLRLSQDQLVGLTKEGGICCKKLKGFGTQEYHILGKFVVASMENRDHSDYHDALLRP